MCAVIDLLRDPLWQGVAGIVAILTLLFAVVTDWSRIRQLLPRRSTDARPSSTTRKPVRDYRPSIKAALLLGASLCAVVLFAIGLTWRLFGAGLPPSSQGSTAMPITGTSPVTPTVVTTPTLMPRSTQTPAATATPPVAAVPTSTPAGIPSPIVGAQVLTSAVAQSPSPTTGPTAPTTTRAAVTPRKEVGTLSVKTLEGCDNSFDIKVGDQRIGGGNAGAKTLVAAGIYDVVFNSDFGEKPIEKGVIVRKGEETVVDFTQKLGMFRLTGYPQREEPLIYWLVQSHYDMYVSKSYCVVPSVYKVNLVPLGGEMIFDAEVKAGKETIIGPETWPKQLGLISFKDSCGYGQAPRFRAYDSMTGSQVASNDSIGISGFAYFGRCPYWIVAGTYRIVISDPYPGLTYDNVEIRAGEETVLKLPETPSP